MRENQARACAGTQASGPVGTVVDASPGAMSPMLAPVRSSLPPRSLLVECVELIARRRGPAIWSHVVVLAVPLSLAWGTDAWVVTLTLALTIVAYVLGSAVHMRWYLSRPRDEAEARRFTRTLGVQFVALGLLYNALFIYQHLHGITRALDYLVFITAAYCAATAATFQHVRWLPLSFIVASIAPQLVFHLTLGTQDGYLIAGLLVTYALFMSRTVGHLHKDSMERVVLTLELETAKRRAERLARTDALTRLFNRRAFEERAEAAIARAREADEELSLVLVDIDHFKAINDAHGHPTGDAALVAIGQTLHGEARPTDAVGRVGGEEFALLLPDTGERGARAFAERVRHAVEELVVTHEESELRLTISLGIASLGPDEGDLVALLGRADRALYAAKQAGRNRVETAPAPT